MNRYKITLSSNTIYKEIELAPDACQIKVGTGVDCDIRLRKELFFGQIELLFVKNEDKWTVHCSDGLYLTVGDIRKLMTKTLVHGDALEIKYQESDNLVFTMDFLIDFDDGKKYERIIDVSEVPSFTIGTSEYCNIVIGGEYVKNDVIVLNKVSDGFVIDIQNITYGVYINGKKAKSKDVIKNGDFLSISDFFFYFKAGKIFTQIRRDMILNSLNYIDQQERASYPNFVRNTRVRTIISDEKIEILDPPLKPQKNKNNIFLQLLPSLGMLVTAGLMASMGGTMIIFSLVSGGLAILTTILSFVENKKEYKKNVTERTKTYKAYISNKRNEVEEIRLHEKELLEKQFVSLDVEKERFNSFSPDLFDRAICDEDFLCVRLGSGCVIAKRAIDYKKQERLEMDDELQIMPKQVCQEYSQIGDAPVVCDFKNVNAIGVFGEYSARYAIFKNIVVDLVSRQFYSDLKMIFVASEEHRDDILGFRFLPFVYLDDIGVRGIVCNDESKNVIFEYLYKEMTAREHNKTFLNRIVVFFYDEYGFNNHPISKFINKAQELGVTFIFFADSKESIPMGCGYLIECVDCSSAKLIDTSGETIPSLFDYQYIDDASVREIVNIIAPISTEEISLEGTLTKNISVFELLRIISVDDLDLRERWSKSKVYKSMAAPVGVSKTGVVYLDLHDKAHGPHGLVAGTTGSGKSEILQTYILSMASIFAPDEVGFLIIDFKGGGMVNQFKDLPHLLGAITNIDGKEVNRSLKSIKAELQKRQRMFAAADVNHIDKYIRKYKENEVFDPLPHLIIIVDEFAELKAEHPDFMKELISAARIGRSLGVHLILATQKPSGQVDDQIWSNSRFKLCLKVQTQDDSNEVLKSPLAAEIKEPGRAYFQVGNNEIFELFQSAYSGAPENQIENTVREFTIYSMTHGCRRLPVFVQQNKKADEKSVSQLEAMVKYISDFCSNFGISRLANICLPPLACRVLFETVPVKNCGAISRSVPIGIYDDPDNQKQDTVYMDIAGKNTLIIGAPQSGKTNLLQTMIRGVAETNSSSAANIYIIDFASMSLKTFESMAHVGGVVTSSDDEMLKNLFKLLHSEVSDRKKKMLDVGVSSYSAYIDAGYNDLPQIYLFIDNLTALIELYLQDDDTLLVLIREGLAVGISTIVANSQTSGIGYRYLSNFSNRIALYCNDSNEYANLFDQASIQTSEIPGRCVLSVDKRILECQSYLSFDGEKEIDRVKAVYAFIEAVNEKNNQKRARQIPSIPPVLTQTAMVDIFDAKQEIFSIPVGVTYSDVVPFAIDLSEICCFGICGQFMQYQSGLVKHFLLSLQKASTDHAVEVCIIDDVQRTFADVKSLGIVQNYCMNANSAIDIIKKWHKKLEERYYHMLEDSEADISNPLLLLVIQNNDVAKVIGDDFDTMNLYNEMITRYKAMGICIIFSNYSNVSLSYDAPEPLRQIKQEQHLFFFGDLDTLKPFEPPYEAIRENKKKIGSGDAYYIRGNDVVKLKVVDASDELVV